MAWCPFCHVEVDAPPGEFCGTCGYHLESSAPHQLTYQSKVRRVQPPPPPIMFLPPAAPRQHSPLMWGFGIVVGIFLGIIFLVFIIPFLFALLSGLSR